MADQLLSVYNTLDSSSSFLTRPSAGKKIRQQHTRFTLGSQVPTLILHSLLLFRPTSTLATASISSQDFSRYEHLKNNNKKKTFP